MRRQILILSGISLLFTGVWLFRTGTGCVTWTYAYAAKQVFQGLSPYASNEGCDWFKYSPLFTFLYWPFAWLPSAWQALTWGMFGTVLYWTGITSWFRFSRETPVALWLALMICSMELDGSTRYQQVNSHLIGLTLIGLARLRDDRNFEGGFWLALAANLKILPGIFFLLVPWKGRMWSGVACAIVLSLVVPAAWVGATETVAWHRQWFALLLRDTGGAGLADIQSMLGSLGLFELGRITRLAVLGLTAVLIIPARISGVNLKEPSAGAWLGLLLAMVLLVSPRTESPTFVMAAPAFLFLSRAILALSPARRRLLWPGVATSGILMTLIYNDVWRAFFSRVQSYAPKAIGVLVLWLVCLILVARRAAFLEPRRLLKHSPASPCS